MKDRSPTKIKKQGERRTRVRKNMKAERRALKVEHDLKEESVNLQQPDLYQERLSGENSKQQRARRWKIRRGLDAAKAASNEMVVDQVVEEAMGQPGQFAPNCRGDPFQGHFYGDTYHIKGQTSSMN